MIQSKRRFFTFALLSFAVLLSLGNDSCKSRVASFCAKAYSNSTTDLNGCISYCPGKVHEFMGKKKLKRDKATVEKLEAACFAGQYGVLVRKMDATQGRQGCNDRYGLNTRESTLCIAGVTKEDLRKSKRPSGNGIGGDRDGGRETGMAVPSQAPNAEAPPSENSTGESDQY